VPIRLLQRGICGCALELAKAADATKMPLPITSQPIQTFAFKTLVFMRNPPSWPAEKTPSIDGEDHTAAPLDNAGRPLDV